MLARAYSVKIGVIFRRPVWKTKSWQKKQTYMKTETCKLYSGDFWIFLPKIIKIDLYNSELYTVSKLVHFLRHSVLLILKVIYQQKYFSNAYILYRCEDCPQQRLDKEVGQVFEAGGDVGQCRCFGCRCISLFAIPSVRPSARGHSEHHENGRYVYYGEPIVSHHRATQGKHLQPLRPSVPQNWGSQPNITLEYTDLLSIFKWSYCKQTWFLCIQYG